METVRANGSQTATHALADLQKRHPVLAGERMQKAFRTAAHIYESRPFDQMERMTLFSHACGVLRIFVEFCPDEDALVACLLQHALKCEYPVQTLEEEFGKNVRDIVSRIHLLSHMSTTDWRRSVDDLKIMLVSVADDTRVLILKLCIQCHLIENLDGVKEQMRTIHCRQSLQLFAPVAARLGIYALKYRLEERAFPVAYATDAQAINRQIDMLHKAHGNFLKVTVAHLRAFLAQEGAKAEVMAREKHAYSLFQKMQRKSITDIEKVTDLIAVRVIVPTLPDCYQVLGLLHRLATPISHRFKDYISFPKPNGYQSLHTSLIGLPGAPNNLMIEVQIRTADMHREAEYGIAAHWMYKEERAIQRSVGRMQLNDVLLRQQSVSRDKGDNADLRLVDHIYVLTPHGDIIELPDGGTPLDFAFCLHTDLGLKFKSARVNGGIVPISHKLENGDVVEILTHKHPRPALHWMEELATPSARSKLKAYFFSHNRAQFISRGREMLADELKTRKLPGLDADLTILKTFDGQSQSMREREDLLVKIGMGSVRTSTVLSHLSLDAAPAKKKNAPSKTKVPGIKELIAIGDRSIDMPYRFAKCCSPNTIVPRPKHIVGFITRSGDISVHKDDCRMVKTANPDRKISVSWGK
ncbi:MAG TPA: TGS domain-containing protein [Candidatus Peribacteria bacterium]|nr:TGS domain-containing protein [Candidatus Peribacteria bacterium]